MLKPTCLHRTMTALLLRFKHPDTFVPVSMLTITRNVSNERWVESVLNVSKQGTTSALAPITINLNCRLLRHLCITHPYILPQHRREHHTHKVQRLRHEFAIPHLSRQNDDRAQCNKKTSVVFIFHRDFYDHEICTSCCG